MAKVPKREWTCSGCGTQCEGEEKPERCPGCGALFVDIEELAT